MKRKRQIIIVIGVLFILTIPLTVMQFTDEVDWTILDFVVAGVLLFGTGLFCEIVIRKVSNISYRIVICIALLIILILIWLEFAVGIFGTPIGGY